MLPRLKYNQVGRIFRPMFDFADLSVQLNSKDNVYVTYKCQKFKAGL